MNTKKKRLLQILSAVVLLTAACSPSETGRLDTEPPPDAPLLILAFNVLHDADADDYEVYTMELDGGNQRNVTGSPAVDWAYMAEDDRLYILSDRNGEERRFHLFEMRSDGSSLRQVTTFGLRDSWMGIRQSGEMVVASSKDGSPELYLIDRDGRELHRLTDDEVYDNDPVFSPDGRRIAWRSKASASGLDELWLMNADGTGRRQLTEFPDDDPAATEHAYHAGPPRWIPGEERVSFCSKRNGNASIFSIGLDGDGLTQMTDDRADECWHDWSPDGRYLAYDGTDPEGDEDEPNYDIYLRDMQTGATLRLTDDPRYEQAPVFVRAVPAS